MSELTESELFEKAYLLLLARVNVSAIDISDTATYPSIQKHPVEDETEEVPWFADTSIKISQLAEIAVQDIMLNRKRCRQKANHEKN
jgi:hypothetical protein